MLDGPSLWTMWPVAPLLRFPSSSTLVAGAAEVDITPAPGAPLAGHGAAGAVARGTTSPLVARVVTFDGPDGPFAMVHADLFSGTGALRDAIEERTGFVGRLVLTGTHTHHGPGGPAVIDHIADQVAAAIHQAVGAARPARIGAGRARVDARLQSAEPWVSAIAIVGDDGPIAVLGRAAAHTPASAASSPFYSADWPGVAVAVARRAVGGVVGIAVGARVEQGHAIVQVVGTAVGRALGEAARAAVSNAVAARCRLHGALIDGLDSGPERWPVHVLELGRHWLATVPGEPTVALGARIEATLVAHGAATAGVLGYAGEYAGHFTTPEEYGASTRWDRQSGAGVLSCVAALAGATFASWPSCSSDRVS